MQNSNVKGHIVESGIFLVGYMVSSLVVLWGIGFGRLHQHGDTIVTYSILFGTLETLKILLTGKILRVVLFFTNVFTGYYLMAFIDIIRRRCSIHDISPLNTGTYELFFLLGIVLSGFSYILLLIKHLHTRNGDLKWRKNIRRTKKRVSEIERERGQVQQMKLEPMEFSDEPASGELQHKELSKQENPIVGEEVEAEYVGEMEKFVAGFIGGKRVYGTVSNAAIELLKKFENPPVDDDGKVGLHLPGDGTITYGYGIVIGRGDEISDELRQKYPPMSEEDATAQLRAAVAERARYVSNKLANRGLRATQQEFDAFVLDEYQSGDSSPLMERAQSLETLEELIQLFQRPSTIYPGLLKRREAEARVYFEGDYSEDFSY